MTSTFSLKRLRTVAFAVAGFLCGSPVFAGSTVISTSNYAYNGSNNSRSFTVPSGANSVTISAWGTNGYVNASYSVSQGNTLQVTLNRTNSTTTVSTPNGTITVSNSTCTAGGSAYNITTQSSGGPSSPGSGNSYAGYVTIVASNTTYTLSISASPSSAGTYSGQGTYTPGTKVTIQEVAYSGYSTAGWGGTDVGSVSSPSSASSSIVMGADKTIVANFNANVPVFTSGNGAQTLVVGRAYTYQISATQSPVYSATGLPPGLTISSTGLISGTPTAAGSYSGTITASNNAVSVEEAGVGTGEIITISATNTGNNIQVYDTTLDLEVNGVSTIGFCIDPWHSSIEGQSMAYNWEPLSNGPKVADGMGTTVATEIGQLWDQYYSANMSAVTAAGLQLAIWELVSASISSQTGGAFNFTLDSSNNYGASSMIAWLNQNPNAPSAALDAVTGTGQDYVVTTSVAPQTSIASASETMAFNVYVPPAVASQTASIPLNQPYSYTISATNNPSSYSAAGLPPGLSLNAATGVISGTPTSAGSYSGSMSATNPGGTGSGTLNLTIQPMYTLTISGAPTGGGTVTGAGTYAAGTVVTVCETAGTGYRTNGWSGTDSGSLASKTNATTTITMSANRSITANYIQQVTLTVNSATGGTATSGGTYDIGTTVSIAETAGSGYRTNGWTGPDSGSIASPTNASSTIVLNGNKTITPSFVQQVVLTVVAGTGGTVTGAGTYDVGALVSITETSQAGYRTNGWTGPGVSNVTAPSSASTTITMSGNETIDASFVQQVVLTVVAGTGGTAGGSGTYDVGTTVQIGETANGGYRTNGWTGPGASAILSPTSAYTSILMNANETIDASFVQQGVLSVNSGPGGTATGGGTYDVGTYATIVATANSGSAFTGWTGSNVTSNSTPSTTVLITGNESVSAGFVSTYTLTIVGATGGTTSGAGTYPSGTVVTVTETPGTSYRTATWTGPDAGSLASQTSASTTITMTGNKTIDAAFVQQATLTVISGTGGTATGGGTYDIGSTVPITETANTGYRTNGWTGPDGGIVTSQFSPSTTITLNANATVDASFVQQAILTVISGAGGSATGGGTYDVGTVVPVTETANAGYRASGWGGPDAGSLASETNTSTSITLSANATVDANFIKQVTLTVDANTGGAATGSGTYDIGSVVTIAATPSTGYAFNDWTGSGPANSGATSTTVTLNSDDTVTANFSPLPPTVTLNASTTAYTGSPFHVTSAAAAPADNLTLHSIEWLSPSNVWSSQDEQAQGGSDNMALGISFASTGVWTLRAGVSTDNGTTWVYSPSTQVTVTSGFTNYTLQSMAVPNGNVLLWYSSSPVVQKTYEVQHVNP